MSVIVQKVLRGLLVLLLPTGIGWVPCAQAQIASGGDTALFRSDAAGVRVEPQFEPRLLALGPLQAEVLLTARSVADSNIFRTSKGGAADLTFEILPSLRLLGSFGPHHATFSARAAVKRLARFRSENSETIDLSLGGRADFGSGSSTSWRMQYARDVESRGSAGSNIVAAGPPEFQTLQSAFTVRSDLGRLGVSAAAGIVQRSYLPLHLNAGGTLDQSFRDTRVLSIAPRASFGITSSAALFVAGSAIRTTSLNRARIGSRDAGGYTLLAGFRTETNGLVIGEIGVGRRGQNYRNPLFKDYHGLTYDATIDWYPTTLVSLRVQAGQDIVNSGLANVAGIVRRTVAANAYYDPLRNLRFNLGIEREHDIFREIKLSTNMVSATLTGRYQFGRHLGASSYFRLQTKDASDSKRLNGYTSVAVGIALTGSL